MATDTRFFDERAQKWEENCYPPEVRFRLTSLFQEFDVQTGERVLDVGTGPGILLPHLRGSVGISGWICALDLSFEMIRTAKAKPLGPMDLLLQADIHKIPFRTSTFDRVICFAAFPHFKYPERALVEMGRVLKPGGVLIIAHLMSREELAAHHATHQSVKRDRLPEDHDMRALLENAGFDKAEITDISGKYLARAIRHDS